MTSLRSLSPTEPRIELTVGDICFCLSTSDPTLQIDFADELQPFRSDRGGLPTKALATRVNVDLTVRAADLTNAEQPQPSRTFDSGGLWRVYEDEQNVEFVFSSPAIGAAPYRLVKIDKDYRRGEILLHEPYLDRNKSVHPLEYPLDELLLVHLLARHAAGIELHGVGLITSETSKNQSILFLGQSGAGKTTTAQLWAASDPTVRILSDDRIIVRPVNQEMWMFGTPWHGEGAYALAHQTPISRIFFLKQSVRNLARPLPHSEAVARLFACSFAPVYLRDELDASMAFLAELTQRVPCFELEFLKDQSAVDYVLANF